jgi:hypothetical protein
MVKGCSTISIFLKRKGRTRLVGAWGEILGWVVWLATWKAYQDPLPSPKIPNPTPFSTSQLPSIRRRRRRRHGQRVNKHPSLHHTLDGLYESVVDEP